MKTPSESDNNHFATIPPQTGAGVFLLHGLLKMKCFAKIIAAGFVALVLFVSSADAELFNNQPDTRRTPTDHELKNEFSAIGAVLHRSAYERDNAHSILELGVKGYMEVAPNSLTTAFAIQCPDGVNDVLLTNSHAFKSAKAKTNRIHSFKKGTRYAQKQDCFKSSQNYCYRKITAKEYAFVQGRLGNSNYVRSLRGENKWPTDVIFGWTSSQSQRDYDDWAVVKMNTPVPSYVQALKISNKKLNYGDCIKTMGWFQSRKHNFKNPVLKKQTCKFQGINKQGALVHNCQTFGGASGSPIMDCKTNEVVGIHRGSTHRTTGHTKGIFSLRGADYNYNLGPPITHPKLQAAIQTQCAKN